MKKTNKRCPMQAECGMTCLRVGEEKDCAYYQANRRPGFEIEDQEPDIWNDIAVVDAPESAGRDKAGETVKAKTNLVYLDINRLFPHPRNPRKDLGDLTELAESIKLRGVMQNLTVVPMELVDPDATVKLGAGHYTVVIGHRRRAAAQLAGLLELPCAIVEMSERDQVATMLLENIQRADLTVMEQAEGFQMMLDLGETVAGISEKTGFSESTVRHRIKLNDLDKKKLSEASMRGGRLEDYIALEKIKDEKARNKLLGDVGTQNFNWNLKNALKEQQKPERKKALVCELNKFAKPIKEAKGLEWVSGWYDFEGKVDKPKDAKTAEYFYTIDDHRATLYKKPSAKTAPKKSAKQIGFEDRKAQIEALAKKAYNSRRAFVEGITATKKTPPKYSLSHSPGG
jgi:ParB-like partition proteins